MNIVPIKKNQIWINKVSGVQVLVSGKKGFKWKTKVLTEKPGVFAGTHTFHERVLWLKFELYERGRIKP